MGKVTAIGGILALLTGIAVAGQNPAMNPKADYVRPYLLLPHSPLLDGVSRPRQKLGGNPRTVPPGTDTCLTIRSLIVERRPGTDETNMVGQRTCTPASRFRVKEVQRDGR